MKLFIKTGLLIGSCLLALTAQAEAVTKDVADRILQELGLPGGTVEASPVPGFVQVETPRSQLLYVSEDAKFIFTGTLYGIDPEKGIVDLREAAMRPNRKQLVDAIPVDQQIVFPASGETKAHIYVFTDVDCGYCRKLHREVPELNASGIEVRYLAYTRELGNPAVMSDAREGGTRGATYKKMVSAWCADDKLAVMTALKEGSEANSKLCSDHPVIEQYQLGSQLGVTGTPAIVLADGTLQPGYVPAPELIRALGL
ncbi:MAG: bifunctional protein-disulfide isomerase/oxidoreductase DsbC [Candidatus Pelagadaptatus aseana]|uniref:DsbC family protein n=1 Tax=Candidatus Pelagadaptatus aseana TaxID=3120508 RepID=UPI0039B153B7